MPNFSGPATDNARRERRTLTVNAPLIDSCLADGGFEGETIQQTKVWGNKLLADSRSWLLRGGLAERGRITKRDAHQMFAHELGGARK